MENYKCASKERIKWKCFRAKRFTLPLVAGCSNGTSKPKLKRFYLFSKFSCSNDFDRFEPTDGQSCMSLKQLLNKARTLLNQTVWRIKWTNSSLKCIKQMSLTCTCHTFVAPAVLWKEVHIKSNWKCIHCFFQNKENVDFLHFFLFIKSPQLHFSHGIKFSSDCVF